MERHGSPSAIRLLLGLALLVTTSNSQHSADNALLHEMSTDGEWFESETRGTYAQFSLNRSEISAEVAIALDINGSVAHGCDENTIPKSTGKIVVIRRGSCRFLLKAWNVHLSGAIAMVVIDHEERPDPPIMSSGMEYIPVRMVDMVSIAVRHSLGEHLIKRAAGGEQVLLRIEFDELRSRNADDAANDYTSRIVSYTCGVAIAAIMLVMATRICSRNHNQLGIAMAALIEAENRDLERCDELLKGLEGYNFDTAHYLETQGRPGRARSDEQTDGGGPADNHTEDGGLPFPSLANRLFDTPVHVIASESVGDGPAPDCESLNGDSAGAGEVPTCCVCLADFEDDERVLRLPCGHEFHDVCIAEWLRKHRECPLCKDNVYERHFGPATETEPLMVGIPDDARVQASSEATAEEATAEHARPEGAPTAAAKPATASATASSDGMLRDLRDHSSTSSVDGLLANGSPSLGRPSPERNLSYTDVVELGVVREEAALDQYHHGAGSAGQATDRSRDAADVAITEIDCADSVDFVEVAGTLNSVSTL